MESRQAELAASGVTSPSLLASLQDPFPVGFARHNSSLELATTGKVHLLELALKQPSSRTILSWKPCSNLTPKEPMNRHLDDAGMDELPSCPHVLT